MEHAGYVQSMRQAVYTWPREHTGHIHPRENEVHPKPVHTEPMEHMKSAEHLAAEHAVHTHSHVEPTHHAVHLGPWSMHMGHTVHTGP